MIRRVNAIGQFLKSQFSTASPQLKDWEYISQIQTKLKQNNINEALKYLINSSLSGSVLDVHVYRNFYMKIQELKYGKSYEEIAYKLYREHFKPQILILDWMNSLAHSSNPKILSMLESDYEYLKISMPKVEKVSEQQQDAQMIQRLKSAPTPQNKSNERVSASETKQSLKSHPISKTVEIDEKTSQNIIEKLNLDKFLDISPLDSEKGKNLIHELSMANAKIILHNVQFIYDGYNEYEDPQKYGHEEYGVEGKQEDEEEVEIQDMEYLRKIKVQKIQILTHKNDKEKESDKDSNKSPKK